MVKAKSAKVSSCMCVKEVTGSPYKPGSQAKLVVQRQVIPRCKLGCTCATQPRFFSSMDSFRGGIHVQPDELKRLAR